MLKYIWNLLPFDMSNSITMDLEKSGINTPKDKEDQMTQELIKEAESIKHTHNTIKEQKPLGNGKALWTVHSDYIENLENIKEKLTEALKEKSDHIVGANKKVKNHIPDTSKMVAENDSDFLKRVGTDGMKWAIENLYQIRNLLLSNAIEGANNDVFKIAFLSYLGLQKSDQNADSDKAYMRCALSGIQQGDSKSDDLTRVLGQSAFLEGTPMPWVSDIWAVLGIKLAAYNSDDENIVSQFHEWVKEFLPQRIKDGRLSEKEQSLAEYILNNELTISSASCVLLFLHYKDILPINDLYFQEVIESFMEEFKQAYKEENLTPIIQALYVFVFDRINAEMAAVPPTMWQTDDALGWCCNMIMAGHDWGYDKALKEQQQVMGMDEAKIIELESYVMSISSASRAAQAAIKTIRGGIKT